MFFLFGTCVPRICVWRLVENGCRTGTNKVAKRWDGVMSTWECNTGIVRAVRSSRPTSTTGSSFTVYRVKATKMERVASQGHSRGAGRAKTWSCWISVAQSLSLCFPKVQKSHHCSLFYHVRLSDYMMDQTQPLWYSFMALPRLCPTLFMKEMQYECVCLGLSRSWTIIRALSPKFDYFESLFLFSQKTTGCLKKPLMHRMQFSCMCYIPVTAHHAHDLFIDVLLVVFLWQHSGLLWNIYLFLSLHCLVKSFF